MNYSINWYREFEYENKVSEVIISFDKKNPAAAVEFCRQKRESLRVIIDVQKLTKNEFFDNFAIFKATFNTHPNIAFRINRYDMTEAAALQQEEIPFFYGNHASTIDELNQYINEGVSDVYVTNELGFCLEDIKYYICKDKVKIRVYPNIAQSSATNADKIPSITKFFIRPEDVKHYENCVDVFEFFGDIGKQGVLYKIYNSGSWDGPLDLIITGYNPDEDVAINSSIIPVFGKIRKNCHKKCGFTSSGCQICFMAAPIAKTLIEKGIKFKEVEKDAEENN